MSMNNLKLTNLIIISDIITLYQRVTWNLFRIFI